MTASEKPEAWLRGSVDGFEPLLMPVVHALVQVREDLAGLLASVPEEQVWLRPGGAASIGFHVRHTGGALDRLFTYARGQALSEPQVVYMKAEGDPGDPPAEAAELVGLVRSGITAALGQVRGTPVSELATTRAVGRKQLPTTVLGLLFHGAEHCTRHAGQMITTAKVVLEG